MPETISKADDLQIIGGIFSDRSNADEAIEAFRELGISDADIQTVFQFDDHKSKNENADVLLDREVVESQARYYVEKIREGKIFVAVHNVRDPAPVIDIFDQYNAEYNPDGSRNLRQDVLGMTAGVAMGAAALGAVGAAVGGPTGALAGAAAGVVLGGGAGAAAGIASEHRK